MGENINILLIVILVCLNLLLFGYAFITREDITEQ